MLYKFAIDLGANAVIDWWTHVNIAIIILQTNKPLVEKRRRERMNRCLDELQNLLVDSRNGQSKLEKADILELAVNTIRDIKRQVQSQGVSMG